MNDEVQSDVVQSEPQSSHIIAEIAAQLRSERKQQSLSITEVAHALHLDEVIIEKLETGEIENNTGQTYLAGYIRSYAKLLKLPVDEILHKLAEQSDDDQALVPSYLQGKANQFKSGSNSKTFFVIVAVVVVLLAVTWWAIRNFDVFEKVNPGS